MMKLPRVVPNCLPSALTQLFQLRRLSPFASTVKVASSPNDSGAVWAFGTIPYILEKATTCNTGHHRVISVEAKKAD
jgi:hypothetical protein